MMEEVATGDDSYDSLDEQMMERPKGERWAPLGAIASPPPTSVTEHSHVDAWGQLQKLEEEQEQLNSSLLALTTHFAQVQFRLKQIVNASAEDKEALLQELEQFAFQGCPDVRGCTAQDAQILEDCSEKERESKMTQQREKQVELINQLKKQLDDLEEYAYEMILLRTTSVISFGHILLVALFVQPIRAYYALQISNDHHMVADHSLMLHPNSGTLCH